MHEREGSEYDRLFYPFLFAGGKNNLDDVLNQLCHSTRTKCQDLIELRRSTLERMSPQIIAAAWALADAFARGATLFACGNGGSATDAQDLVTDLLYPPLPSWRELPAVALPDDIAVITAIGNDIGFEPIFARQLIAFGRPGDIVVAFSTSGNSANILLALEQAKKQEMLTIALVGYDGGKMRASQAVDFCLVASSSYIPRIQEVQATIYHTLLEVLHTLLNSEACPGGSNREGVYKKELALEKGAGKHG